MASDDCNHRDVELGYSKRKGWPISPRELLSRLNRPRVVESQLLRIVCGIIFVIYVAVVSLRELQPEYASFYWIRLWVAFYCLVGAIVAHRFSWVWIRYYTIGFALLLSLSTAYMEALRGNDLGDIALTLLATFATLLMLLTAKDLMVTIGLLLVGHATILELWPPTVLPLPSVWGLLLGVLVTGGICSFILSTQRVLMSESIESWQASRTREGILQRFAEFVSEPVGSEALCSVLVEYFQSLLPESHCVVLLVPPEGGGVEVVAQVSASGAKTSRVSGRIDESVLPFPLRGRVERRPLAGDDLRPEQVEALAEALALPFRVHHLAVVPFPRTVPGVILVLSSQQRVVGRDVLVTLQTMANQAGVALAYARARDEEHEQQERRRRLVEERAAVAQMRNDFVIRASHEFRTPLAIILAARDTLERYRDRLTPEQQAGRLCTIRSGVEQITELLDDVLAIGRGDAGKVECQREPVDLGALSREVIAELEKTSESAHRLVLACQGVDGSVRVDPKLTRRILRNLLGNAVKYSPDGGTIELAVRYDGGGAVFRVRDHGIGISAEDKERLFEAFHRGRNVASIAGSGLGLTIVKQAVELHGGVIEVESEPGVGTTVEVRLPADLPDTSSDAS